MTTIVIQKDENQAYRTITCMGHAGYARNNEPDILCASISVLVMTTLNALEELAGEKMQAVELQETGFIRCVFEGELQEKSVFLLDSMVFGLEQLVKNYGEKYLQVKFEEV